MVIDWRIGNYDYENLCIHGITDTPSKPNNNITDSYIKSEEDDFFIDKQREIIHNWLDLYSNLSVVFWCCYVRTCLEISWKPEGQYASILDEFAVSKIISKEDIKVAIIFFRTFTTNVPLKNLPTRQLLSLPSNQIPCRLSSNQQLTHPSVLVIPTHELGICVHLIIEIVFDFYINFYK